MYNKINKNFLIRKLLPKKEKKYNFGLLSFTNK